MPTWVPVLLLEVIVMGRQVRRNLVGTWCDYLHGKTDIIPQPQGDDKPFNFDEHEFLQLIGAKTEV